MVQRHIRLLTGRFQVRILVAEPTELEIGVLGPTSYVVRVARNTRVLAGRFQVRILAAQPLNSKSAISDLPAASEPSVDLSEFGV